MADEEPQPQPQQPDDTQPPDDDSPQGPDTAVDAPDDTGQPQAPVQPSPGDTGPDTAAGTTPAPDTDLQTRNGQVHTVWLPEPDLQVRSASRREIGLRIMPWNVMVDTPNGPEIFEPGAFDGTDPGSVVLRMEHADPAAGVGTELQQRSDAAYMVLRASATQRGDEILTLAQDRVTRGASVAFVEVPGGTRIEQRNGRRVRVHRRVALREVSTTWRPVYPGAAVEFVRSQPDDGGAAPAVPQTNGTQPEPGPVAQGSDDGGLQVALATSQAAVAEQLRALAGGSERILDRLERLEERSRQDAVIVPQARDVRPAERLQMGVWTQTILRMLSGERVSDLQTRALADLITSDNLGVVPDAFMNELVGEIDPSRPFLQTTRELPTPDSGLSLQVPVLVTRPTVGVQATEKSDIVSTTTSITTTGFDAVTIAGGGDISLQLLKRSSPSYLDLYLQLLAEAYAIESESQAVATLLDSGVTPGSAYIDPENLLIGEAWGNAVAAKQRPTHIWLSTLGVQAFIDAKADGTNQPLYGNIAADISVANGAQGLISGLRPVYVPSFDGSGCDVLIGPSRGFAWAEDGTYTLQVDVPSKAGRDVALVGILWFAPLYPSAFTSYRLAS